MLTLSALVSSLVAATPVVGEVAPDFTVKDVDGVELKLSTLVTRGPVILAFFPKAFTGGCTRELTAYRDRYAEIEKHGGKVVAISMDDVETEKRFRDSLKAPYPFVADPKGEVVKLFDVKLPVLSMSKRVTFVVGAARKILMVQEGNDAIEPTGAISACSITSSAALKLVTGKGSDAGRE